MENPFEQSAPDDYLERIHAFARDLAYGVAVGLWGSKFFVNSNGNEENWKAEVKRVGGQTDPFFKLKTTKWENKQPPLSTLISFGYLATDDPPPKFQGSTVQSPLSLPGRDFFLTSKAFALLERPLTPPSIFISYKRNESSALGLLIEARLKLIDRNIQVFIDKLLEPGDKWHSELEEKVRQCHYFICLLGPKTLGSEYVRREIWWALEEADKGNCVIIPVCHNEYNFGSELPDELHEQRAEIEPLLARLNTNNGATVFPERAEEYELAMIKIINKLGYSTIA
ncbi:MAG: toll/interleukin-1 receptor domain-containing protein [Anaerolineae bacterium]|nr:toll/interleukin-1 receptor domain-containing protein [Anaerolineae bacterium]